MRLKRPSVVPDDQLQALRSCQRIVPQTDVGGGGCVMEEPWWPRAMLTRGRKVHNWPYSKACISGLPDQPTRIQP